MDAKPEEIDPLDSIHALSNLCRFGGHTKYFYSVAQHSMMVCQYLKDNGYGVYIQLLGLIHDFVEGYMVDLPRPIKVMFPEYSRAEDELFKIILETLNIEFPSEEEWSTIKFADNIILLHEANLLDVNKNNWAPKVDLPYTIEEELPSTVKNRFINIFNEIYKQYISNKK